MSVLDAVTEQVSNWCRPFEAAPYIVVPTFNIYPSNSCVNVLIEGGANLFVVSDGGGALDVASSLGIGRLDISRVLRSTARAASLKVSKSGWIYQSDATGSELTSVISVVAECSKEAAVACKRSFRPESPFNFRNDLDNFLIRTFLDRVKRKPKLLGASNKVHEFDYAIEADSKPTIIIDAVVPDATSINSAIVSHLDVKHANISNIEQRIIYDDRLPWRASDLALLNVGAPPIAFTSVEHSLRRLAA